MNNFVEPKLLKETEYYQKILEVIEKVSNMGMLDRGVGYCFSMSDIFLKLLHKNGIGAELVECSLMVAIKDPPSVNLVGYNGFGNVSNYADAMENHVVCITKTPIPILIDGSLKNIDPNVPYVCIPVTGKENHTNLAEYDFGTSVWTYEKKKDSELPMLHQRSILQRISKDKKIDTDIQKLQKIIISIAVITVLNFIRGTYDFYQKYVVKDNNYGPNKSLVQQK
jgi:hypothetical protein